MKLFEWLLPRKRTNKAFKYSGVIFLDRFGDLPGTLKNSVYIIGTLERPKWAIFNCPNNCGYRIEVNLMKSKEPYWTVKIRRNKVSIYPSIVVTGCGAHFYLVNNQVEWS